MTNNRKLYLIIAIIFAALFAVLIHIIYQVMFIFVFGGMVTLCAIVYATIYNWMKK